MKHAFLIMAHNNFEILNKLLHLLDDVNNDIYVHIDKKAKGYTIWEGNKSNIFVLRKKYDIRWASYDQIKLELRLFSEAYKNGPYEYYHLLSGVDLPLKSNKEIHQFFEKNIGKEFVGFVSEDKIPKECFKVQNYHFFTNNLKNKRDLGTRIHWKLIDFQQKYKILRNKNIAVKKGANWVSITNGFAAYLLKHKNEIKRKYKYTFGADEIFLQSLLWNSPFSKQIYCLDDEYMSCMRKICWERGCPYVWTENDYDELMNSEYMFARKFDITHIEIVNRIYDTLICANNKNRL